jgi:hypothetical protein
VGTPFPQAIGGAGVDLSTSATLLNFGKVSGGTGGANAYFTVGGYAGGTGVIVASLADLTNLGIISGGTGGFAGSTTFFNTNPAGNGGAGVVIDGNGTVSNSGFILGGGGGTATYPGGADGGNGGVGVYISGGTLITSGTIAGGKGGSGTRSDGAAGDAVQFGAVAATLIIDPGAVFDGLVAANVSVNDTLALAGTSAGAVAGLGTEFTGFTTLNEQAGANWALQGANTLASTTTLTDAGALTITGTLIDAGRATVTGQGVLGATGVGAVQIANITLSGGDLTVGAGTKFVVGDRLAGAAPGILIVESGASVTGYGALAGSLDDVGVIVAEGGTLALAGRAAGPGSITIDSGATLSAASALSVATVAFAAGSETLALGAPSSVTSTLTGFGGLDVIDLLKTKATSLAFLGDKLSISNGATLVATLTFEGSYSTADFTLTSDGKGGTDIGFAHAAGLPVAQAQLGAMPFDRPFAGPSERVALLHVSPHELVNPLTIAWDFVRHGM